VLRRGKHKGQSRKIARVWLTKRSKSVVAISPEEFVSIRVYSWLDFPFEIRAIRGIRGQLSLAIICFNKQKAQAV
jgi:hypothetical protein